MYEQLPLNERNFDIDLIGETTGVEYKGRFKGRCVLSIAGTHTLELEKTRLMADYKNPTQDLQILSAAIATIRAKLIEWPSWWDNTNRGEDILDANVILYIYTELLLHETEWKDSLKKKAETAQVDNKEEDAEPQEGEA